MTQTTTVTRDTALAAVTRYLEAIADGSAIDIAALFADDATLEDPVGSTVITGRGAIQDFFGPLEQTQRETELLTFRHRGNASAFHFKVRTFTSNGAIDIAPIDVMTFDSSGLITSARAYWSADDVRQTNEAQSS